QDQLALRLMGVDPVRVKELAFALSIATAGVAGAFLIVIQPVQPAIGREFIGLVFAVCVLGGMGSILGTLLGAFVLGLAESFTSTFFGPSWAPAVSFGLLLATLAFRPSGILGRQGADEQQGLRRSGPCGSARARRPPAAHPERLVLHGPLPPASL